MATTSIADEPIRVVSLRFENGGTATNFTTESNISVEMILEDVAGRRAIEEFFHDTKETLGAGKQQVRNIWFNIACWKLNAWLYALVELECWDTDMNQAVDRSDRPWDTQIDARHMPIVDAKSHWKCREIDLLPNYHRLIKRIKLSDCSTNSCAWLRSRAPAFQALVKQVSDLRLKCSI